MSVSDCGTSSAEPLNVSDEEFNCYSNEDEHRKHKKDSWKKAKKRHRKRRREQSSSGESEIEQGKDVPRWQKLTKEDFVDTIVSDTDDEIDQVEQTVATSGVYSQSIPDEKFYYTSLFLSSKKIVFMSVYGLHLTSCLQNDVGESCATEELKKLHERFRREIIEKIAKEKANQPKSNPPDILTFHDNCKCKIRGHHSDTETESESCDSDECIDDSDERSGSVSVDEQLTDNKDKITHVKMSESKKHSTVAKREVIRKRNHPAILHSDVCFNEIGQMNDGPECRCSWAAKKSGLRHNKYAGETVIEKCNLSSSNSHRLWHYILYAEPNPNVVVRRSTKINYQDRTYELEGFSVFFHKSLPLNFPQTPLSKWTSEYNIKFMKENMPTNFTIEDLELFHHYLFIDIMEMYDLKNYPLDNIDGCPYYHCLPRFVYSLPDGGKEILPMSVVMIYLIENYHPLVTESEAQFLKQDADIFREFAENVRGSLVMNANKRPSTIRVDLIDKPDFLPNNPDILFPLVTHFGVRPSSHTYNSNAEYQKMSKEYLRMRKILAMKRRVSAEERGKLAQKASQLKALRNDNQLKRDFVMSVSSRDFYSTGLFPDIVQHGLLLILACAHVRFQWSLQVYEQERIHYVFKINNRSLLELALTHPSYRTNYGTNSDHARNTLNNCGVRSSKQRVHDRLVQQQLSARKRGFNTLMEIMSKLGSKKAEQSPLNHNERLEFLGDAVIEFITTIHLFYMFNELDEGGLATYRSTMVQNKNLAVLAKKIGLDEFMLYAHGPDLCHESDLRHAMANAFEAMMAAIYLDAGIDECDRIFGHAMFADSKELLSTWFDLEDHPLKRCDFFQI
ncbi:hypothetical protein X798_07946 [Onchocerca flexuosa]|uniref:RNase III domain-containing protein n=1 Tax=Onchocerca flexuosa TaxID=387005 RepID=A0A238BHY8_9BILA|nr:hypothetical protein X798_07946 [Onchocerca flexuosa]